ncbi:pectate lyase superfamily protein-domain-containing protein [Colletotrichum cereale]|nr:pectate lyase superfamily protein-domain-containing protein [Colletotrichum cereale]
MRFMGALASALLSAAALVEDFDNYRNVPDYGPQPNAPYMVDNQNNYFKTAPDKGKQNGPVWLDSGSFNAFMSRAAPRVDNSNVTVYNHTLIYLSTPEQKALRSNITTNRNSTIYRNTSLTDFEVNITQLAFDTPRVRLAETGYWLPQLAGKGIQPIAGSDYKFYRNVQDYGATGNGDDDDTEAINAAIEDGDRCGLECGNTFSQGAIIYFPPGVYKVCRPIIQLYYTQFIGDAIDPPTILGCDSFQGIALIDTDPYIPNGNGANWFINQNQFFRQIRNFRFDLREMPLSTDDNDQPLVPTGIHWQVSQACSLQNLVFEMPEASDDEDEVTHVGIFMENGSGGFVSDLTFKGGNIGWRAGSQQYTTINLKFENCLTAVQMVWSWGFNWQRVNIEGGAIGFNISGIGGDDGQGIGSISLIDSKISNCPIGILTHSNINSPNIVIDNLELNNVATPVKNADGAVLLGSSGKVDLWAIGKRYNGYEGSSTSGAVTAPKKSDKLLDSSGKLFYRPRPQYEGFNVGQFRIATEHGCSNDGTGDNTNAINKFLRDAQSEGQVAYFPAGIYRVGGTVLIPTGSRVLGASWSQIQGAGAYFSDMFNPRVVVQVGIKGDVGTMEVSDMMFNVQGATAGAIVLEWNVHESSQGSAAMWDSHVRVGGATGSDLDVDTCPKFGFNEACICAALLFHVTPQASGYFENVWIWLADHDNDAVVSDSPDKLITQISLYAARGTLIESKGPSWFYGTGSEHTIMYQYQLYGAEDIYLGHIQTETPYFQPVPVAPEPFTSGKAFPGDPSFESCDSVGCEEAWGLRIINSERVTLHGVGLYSFFQEYYQDCLDTFDCQLRLCEVKGSKEVALFNIFSVGTEEIGTGINGGAIMQKDGNQRGFTTEVSVWIPPEGDDEFDVVYVGPEVYDEPSVTCPAPCLLVFPTSSLTQETTISPGSYTTSLEYGQFSTGTVDGQVITTFVTTTTTITIPIQPITTDGMQYSNINITQGQTSSALTVLPSIDIPPIPWPLPDGEGGTTTRTIILPPWPDVTRGPPDGPGWGNPPGDEGGAISGVYRTPFVTTVTATGATVTTIMFPSQVSPISVRCPPNSEIAFNTPKTTITTDCVEPTDWEFRFTCPPSRVVTFVGSSTAVLTADCTLATSFQHWPGGSDVDPEPTTRPPVTTEPLPTWTSWPEGQIETVEDEDDDDDDGVGFITPCSLWFFNICLIKGGIRIRGLRWILPPGIYGPGPVPPGIVRLPTPWTIPIPTPPITWPRITVGRDGKVTYPENEPTSCEKATASFCSTNVIVSITTVGTSSSTFTRTESSCGDEFTACGLTDVEATATTTKTPDSCPLPTGNAKRDVEAEAEDTNLELTRRQDPPPPPGCPANAVIYPRDPTNVGDIPQILVDYAGKYVQVQAKSVSFTSFFWVPYLDKETMGKLKNSGSVEHAYYYEEWNRGVGTIDITEEVLATFEIEHPHMQPQNDLPSKHDSRLNLTLASRVEDGDPTSTFEIEKRAPTSQTDRLIWHLSQDSLPKGQTWRGQGSDSVDANNVNFRFHYDDAGGANQYVYVVGERGYWTAHPEFLGNNNINTLYAAVNFGPNPMTQNPGDPAFKHGSGSASMVVGSTLGICKDCHVRFVATGNAIAQNLPSNLYYARVGERLLQQLLDVLDEIQTSGRQGRAVISMSFGMEVRWMPRPFFTRFYQILKLLEERVQAVLVCSAGNNGNPNDPASFEGVSPARYPARFGDPANPFGHLQNLIVVGATDANTHKASFSNYAPWLTTFAPGQSVWLPDNSVPGRYQKDSGTSFAAPQVAGLAAYYRSLPSPWQTQLTAPSRVNKLVRLFHRRFAVNRQRNPGAIDPNQPALRKPVIWNGQVGQNSCLRDYDDRNAWGGGNVCPQIDQNLDNEASNGQTVEPCGAGNGGNPRLPLMARQNGGGSCPLVPGGPGNGDNGGGGSGHTISFTSGTQPSPTCASGSGCGGVICSGFWCNPKPTGVPPDHYDPKDPSGGSQVPTRTIDPPPDGTPPTSTESNQPEPTCDDKCKLDRGNPCNCDENSCDSQSPSCCPNASCPDCDCGESGCSDSSPACCSSGTCRWSWTGGGGGDGTGSPPLPPPDGRIIVIALSELSINSGMSWNWVRAWDVFSSPANGFVDMCFDRPVKTQTTTSVTGSDPGYPPDLTFDAADGVSCKYTGTPSSVGKLECARVSSITCEGISPPITDFCPPFNNPGMHGVVMCSW